MILSGKRLFCCLLVVFVVGCSAPYDIKKSSPADSMMPLDLLPAEIEGQKMTNSENTEETGYYAGSVAIGHYEDGSVITIAKLENKSKAKSKLHQICEDLDVSTTYVNGLKYSWLKNEQPQSKLFGWTNNQWLFLVEASTTKELDRAVQATGYASIAPG